MTVGAAALRVRAAAYVGACFLARQVDSWPRHQRRQWGDKVERVEEHLRGAVKDGPDARALLCAVSGGVRLAAAGQ